MPSTQVFNLNNVQLPAGETDSPSFKMPQGITQYNATFNMSQTDLQDSTLTMEFEFDHQVNGVFQFDSGFAWQGGTPNQKTGVFVSPSIMVTGIVPGDTYQAKITLSRAVTLSLTIDAS